MWTELQLAIDPSDVTAVADSFAKSLPIIRMHIDRLPCLVMPTAEWNQNSACHSKKKIVPVCRISGSPELEGAITFVNLEGKPLLRKPSRLINSMQPSQLCATSISIMSILRGDQKVVAHRHSAHTWSHHLSARSTQEHPRLKWVRYFHFDLVTDNAILEPKRRDIAGDKICEVHERGDRQKSESEL